MSGNHRSGTTALGTGTVKGVPVIPPARTGDEYWQPGAHHRYPPVTYRLTRRGLEIIGYDPAIHGAPAERPATRAALDPEWW